MQLKDWERCHLVERFVAIAQSQHQTNFNFELHVETLRSRIVDELGYINQLFPEYTPHDEKYHISQLFRIADIILGKELIDHLNAAELFILICALYGHDWGMAVSTLEKERIKGEINEYPAEYLLEDEKDLFAAFRRKKPGQGHAAEIDWPEYIRNTHALRSGQRIRSFFETIDRGLGEAIAKVCEAHWLNIEKLENYNVYPTNFSVINHVVNVKALGVYLRLIDLYDLSQNRTPYVLWKYISPKNPFSAMEWKKHRAIFSITAPAEASGRILKIDGSTDDVEVWAKLKDLQNWSDQQLRSSLDLLARLNDKPHQLDIIRADWNIEAKGFSPINIQFNFDRVKVFTILSDEIYDKDDYVFLRELLQNSIDAIKLRVALLEKEGVPTVNLGKIEIDISNDPQGAQIISFTDNGTGMDEYIIRNYLSVIGKSYYNSEDFERTGVKIDPISRFGIGILSCFKVAPRISILSRQDPLINNASSALEVEIPSPMLLFRVKPRGIQDVKIGTTVKVYVDPAKLTNKATKGGLQVFDYLARVAAFTPFPIIVTENGKRSLIQPYKHALQGSGPAFAQIRQESPGAFLAKKQSIADYIRFETIDVADIPGLEDYEGYIIFWDLQKPYVDLETYGDEFIFLDGSPKPPRKELSASNFEKEGYLPQSVITLMQDIIFQKLIDSSQEEIDNMTTMAGEMDTHGPSSFQMPNYQFFNNGILVSNIGVPLSFAEVQFKDTKYPPPFLRINLKKSLNLRMNVARTRLLQGAICWDHTIHEALQAYLIQTRLPGILAEVDLRKRLFGLSVLTMIYRVSINRLFEAVGPHNWPVLIWTNNDLGIVMLDDLIDLQTGEFKDRTIREVVISPGIEFAQDLIQYFYYGKRKPVVDDEPGTRIITPSSFSGYKNLPEIFKGILAVSYHPFAAPGH